MPVRVVHLGNGNAADQVPGVVDQDVDFVAQHLGGMFDARVDRGTVGGVKMQDLRLAA